MRSSMFFTRDSAPLVTQGGSASAAAAVSVKVGQQASQSPPSSTGGGDTPNDTRTPTQISPPSSTLSFSQFLERKDEIQGTALTNEQIQVLQEFVERIKASSAYQGISLPSEDVLVRFLYARKWNIDRALWLLEQHHARFGFRERPNTDDILELFKTNVLYLAGTRCRDKGEILVFNAREHNANTSFFSYLDLFFYLADIALQSRLTQQYGFTLIINMAQSSWRSFDLRLLNKFAGELQNLYPARLRNIYVVDAPVWTSVLIAGMKPFLSSKLSSKIHLIYRNTLHFYVAVDSIPQDLGGAFSVDLQKFVDRRRRAEANWKLRGRHEGFLVVKGSTEKQWRRRWIVQHDHEMSIYESTDELFPLRVIDLRSCVAACESYEDEKPFAIELRLSYDDKGNDSALQVLHAESATSRQSWLMVLRPIVQQNLQRQEAERAAFEEHVRQVEQSKRLAEEEQRRQIEEEARKRAAEEEQRRREAEAERARQEREDWLRRLHIKRTNIVQELLWTEQSYVDTLRMMTEVYIKPLRAAVDSPRPIVTEAQLRMMFPELSSILAVNSTLLQELETRFATWSGTALIGDIFVRMTESLRIYIGLVNGYNTAVELINKLQDDVPSFKAFLAACAQRPETRSIGVTEHLLTPIQRIPRYVLLLDNLVKNTDGEHEDYLNLTLALEQMRQTADYINEMKRKADSRLRVIEVLEELKGVPDDFELVAPHRAYVTEVDCAELEDESAMAREPLIDMKTMGVRSSAKLRVRRILRLYIFSDIVVVSKVGGTRKLDVPKRQKAQSTSDIRYKLHNRVEKTKLTTIADHSEFHALVDLQIGERRYLVQLFSSKIRDDFVHAFAALNPATRLLRSPV